MGDNEQEQHQVMFVKAGNASVDSGSKETLV